MDTIHSDWIRYKRRALALADSLAAECMPESYILSGQRFIRRIDFGDRQALAQLLKLGDPDGVLHAMRDASFWKNRAVLRRLCIWGWAPDVEIDSNPETQADVDASGDSAGSEISPQRVVTILKSLGSSEDRCM
jgi:hypothetical protein